jgi:hypothetical protein
MAGSYNYPRDVHVRTYMSGMPAYHCIVQCCARANQKNMRMRTPQILRPTWSINTTVALMGRRSIEAARNNWRPCASSLQHYAHKSGSAYLAHVPFLPEWMSVWETGCLGEQWCALQIVYVCMYGAVCCLIEQQWFLRTCVNAILVAILVVYM